MIFTGIKFWQACDTVWPFHTQGHRLREVESLTQVVGGRAGIRALVVLGEGRPEERRHQERLVEGVEAS